MTEQRQYEQIGVIVAARAYEIFEACGRKDDYCVQAVGEVAVFGGWNRLIFSAKYGWYIDRSSCDARFIAAFERWEKEGVANGG